jgi:hypothetical protein
MASTCPLPVLHLKADPTHLSDVYRLNLPKGRRVMGGGCFFFMQCSLLLAILLGLGDAHV